jgi:hypothetical protein
VTTKGCNRSESAMSRRDVLHGVGAAVTISALSDAGLASPLFTTPLAPTPTHDPPDSYKLLGLWLALSTNPSSPFVDGRRERDGRRALFSTLPRTLLASFSGKAFDAVSSLLLGSIHAHIGFAQKI